MYCLLIYSFVTSLNSFFVATDVSVVSISDTNAVVSWTLSYWFWKSFGYFQWSMHNTSLCNIWWLLVNFDKYMYISIACWWVTLCWSQSSHKDISKTTFQVHCNSHWFSLSTWVPVQVLQVQVLPTTTEAKIFSNWDPTQA